MTETYELNVELLEKLVAIHSRDPRCSDLLQQLLRNPETFERFMPQVEDLLEKTKENRPLTQDGTNLSTDYYRLYSMAVRSAPLYHLFQSEPLLSKVDLEQLATLLQFADVTPVEANFVLSSRDALFMRILASANNPNPPSAQKLLLADLAKLVALEMEYPIVAEQLLEVAQQETWSDQLQILERMTEDDSEVTLESNGGLSDEAQRLRELIQAESEEDDQPGKLRSLFRRLPRFSTMLDEEIELYWQIRDRIPTIESSLATTSAESLTLQERSSRVARAIVKGLPPEKWASIRHCFQLRIEAVQHFQELRKFTKINALRHTWPELARRVQLDRSSIIALETQVLTPAQTVDEADDLWEHYGNDEQLIRFMHLRPLFRDIYPDELQKFFDTAETVSPTAAVPSTPGRPETIVPDIAASAAVEAEVQYEELLVHIYKESAEQPLGNYQVKMTPPTGDTETFSIRIPWLGEELEAHLIHMQPNLAGEFGYRSPEPLLVAPRASRDLMAELEKLGQQVFEFTFPSSDSKKRIQKILTDQGKLRLVLELNTPELMTVPWETLYVGPLRRHVALSSKYSIVRRPPELASLERPMITWPLRLLVTLANPIDVAPINAEQEAQVLKRALAPAIDRGQVELRVLEHATPDELLRSLRTFEPHIFHFVGHGMYDKEHDEGAIILEDRDQKIRLLLAKDLKILLAESNVYLAVLNACDTGVASLNNAITGVAGALVGVGVPAAIATMRAIPDQVAILFARELYRAFTDGYTLEASVVEARKALYVERQDWSVYALFAGRSDLASLVLRSQRQAEDFKGE